MEGKYAIGITIKNIKMHQSLIPQELFRIRSLVIHAEWAAYISQFEKDKKRNVAIELGLPDTPGVSGEVYKSLMRKEIVNASHLNNLNDFKLLQVGWIYSINFPPTFDRIKERKYLEIIRNYLPRTEEIDKIFSVVQTHLGQFM